MTKIGAITVGQAPRVDVTSDIMPLLQGCELLEKGGLDGLTRQQIEAFAPQEGDYVLVSRLVDGSSVTFAEKHVLPRLQAAIDELEAQGCRLILFFCTGDFPATFHANVPLIFPNQILQGIRQAAQQVAGLDCDLVVLDCIGYTLEMKQIFAQATGKNIVLSRTLLARVVSELID